MSPSVRDTMRELEQTAVLAELARPLVHECNNFLNTLLLQIALLETEVAEQHRNNFARLRRDGRALASLLQEWQRFRRPSKPAPKTDLNAQLEKALEDLQEEQNRDLPIKLQLAPRAVKITAPPQELKRLCQLLLSFSMPQHDSDKPPPPLEVSTAESEGNKTLILRQARANPAWISGFRDKKESSSRLLPAACKGLAHRLHCRIHLQDLPDGGAVLTLEWPGDIV